MNLYRHYKGQSIVVKTALFLFLALLLCTAFCNRLSADDLFFQYRINTVGLDGIIDEHYSRVAAYFLNGCIIALDNLFVYALYNLVSIFVFAYFLIRVLVLLFPGAHEHNYTFAFVFFLFFFFCCSAPSEVFFWYTQVSTYLWCINCILVITFFLLQGFSHKWQIPFFFIACVFAASSSEFLAIQFLLLLTIGILYRKIVFFRSPHVAVFLSGMILLLISLCITVFSPGMAVRNELLEERYIPDALIFSVFLFGKYLLDFVALPRLFYLLLFAGVFFVLGSRVKHTFKLRSGEIPLYILFTLCNLFFTAYKLSDMAPARALIICDLIGLFLLAKMAIQTGHAFGQQIVVPLTVQWILLAFFASSCFFHSAEAIKYAQAYDEREKIILQSQADPIKVKRLPEPYFISSCKISTDSLHFRNQHLKLAHGLKSNIILSDNKAP